MPGPERALDVLAKQLETQARIQQDLGTAFLKAQTQSQLSQQLTELGIQRAMGEAETEARAAAPEQEQQQPFRLSMGNAIREQKVSFKEPLQQVDPAQFTQAIAALGPNAGVNTALQQTGQVPQGPNVPQAAEGLPVAGDEIVTRTQQFGVNPQRVGQQGFILTPSAQETTTRTPNQLSAQDLAGLRQREIEFQAQQQRLDQADQRARAGAFVETFQGLTAEGLGTEQARGVAEAVARGDSARAAALMEGAPKSLSARVRESAIRENEMQARLAITRMRLELQKGQQPSTRLDLLAGFANFAGEEPPSLEQTRILLSQGLEQDNKVFLRDAQIANLARGNAVFLQKSGTLSRLWGAKDPRALNAYEVVGRINQFNFGTPAEAAEAKKSLEELGFRAARRRNGGQVVEEILPPEGLDQDLGLGLLRVARAQSVAQGLGAELRTVAPPPEEPPSASPEGPRAGRSRQAAGTQGLREELGALRGFFSGSGTSNPSPQASPSPSTDASAARRALVEELLAKAGPDAAELKQRLLQARQ